MKLVVNVERSQLRGVLQELGANFADMDIVINIKEEEFKKKTVDYENLTTEDLQRIQKEMDKREEEKRKEEYPT